MRSIVLIGIGLVLLLAFCFGARLTKGDQGMRRAAIIFIGLWFLVAAINLGIGVISAGYSIGEELPFFLAVFGVPAIVAMIIIRRFRY